MTANKQAVDKVSNAIIGKVSQAAGIYKNSSVQNGTTKLSQITF
jgi:hypothetical protein